MVKPKIGWINLTTACNMRCGGCYAEDVMHGEAARRTTSSMMSSHDVFRLMTQTKEMGCRRIILIGGEPTLHPSFAAAYAYGKHQLGLEVRFVTNGRAFSSIKFCDSLIQAGLQSGEFTFSMHAPSHELSEQFVGDKNGFKQFDQGLRNLLDRGVIPNLNIVLNIGILPHVESMMKYLQDLGLKKVAFNLGSPAVVGNSTDASHCIPPDQLALKVYELFEHGKSIGMRTSYLFLVPFCLLEYSKMRRLVEAGAISSGCQISSGSGVLFNKEGELIPCNHMADKVTLPKDQIQEVIQTGRFDEFWNSDHMKTLRATTSVYRSDHCRTCGWFNMCGGGCSLFWTHFDPRQYIQGVSRTEGIETHATL